MHDFELYIDFENSIDKIKDSEFYINPNLTLMQIIHIMTYLHRMYEVLTDTLVKTMGEAHKKEK